MTTEDPKRHEQGFHISEVSPAFDRGGYLRPGFVVVRNTAGEPERVVKLKDLEADK